MPDNGVKKQVIDIKVLHVFLVILWLWTYLKMLKAKWIKSTKCIFGTTGWPDGRSLVVSGFLSSVGGSTRKQINSTVTGMMRREESKVLSKRVKIKIITFSGYIFYKNQFLHRSGSSDVTDGEMDSKS